MCSLGGFGHDFIGGSRRHIIEVTVIYIIVHL